MCAILLKSYGATNARKACGDSAMTAGPLTIDHLQRWVQAGGTWRVIDIASARVVVDLCACTGETMERLISEQPEVIAYLRTASPDIEQA